MPLNSTRGAASAKAFGFTVGQTFIEATGGTVLTSGDFKTHIFTGDSTFTVTKAPGTQTVEYLVIAGGGSGTSRVGGGAGAGGYRTNFPSPLAGGLAVTATAYPITVGGGGTGSSPDNQETSGLRGNPSVFSTITSTGGGGGGGTIAAPGSPGPASFFNPGGSGGGGGNAPAPTFGNPGTGNTPPVSPPQGNNGGKGGFLYGGGGGGGGGAVGNDETAGDGGPGGTGANIPDTFFGPTAPSYGTPGPVGSTRYFAGGGGGGVWPNQSPGLGGTGGAGGGGSAGNTTNRGPGGPGTVNTGGGGSGATNAPAFGGTGGSGFIAIRYKYK